MYLPNNPIYHRAMGNVRDAFKPVWGATDEIILTIDETDFVWEETVVYQQLNKTESFAWALYKDGMRILTLRRGCEEEEIIRFLQIVNQAKLLPADAGDDLSTLLWEQDFELHPVPFSGVDVRRGTAPRVRRHGAAHRSGRRVEG